MKFNTPPEIYNKHNNIRRAGFEFEFAGLSLSEISTIIRNLYGGERKIINRFKESVEGTALGDFKIEFDSRVLKEKRYEKFIEDKVGLDITSLSFHQDIEEAVATVSMKLVPLEVVSPPIPMDQLYEIEKFRHKLYESEATGTKASVFYAFAFHINPEVPEMTTESILRHLKAFLLLQHFNFQELDINFTRQRLTSYINYFSHEYTSLVLNNDYQPDSEKLIKDYVLFNPTRNRPLDFLPLFVHFKGREVLRHVDDDHDLINGRPTYHYRLPDSLVDDPEWRLAEAWNSWIRVEKLAANPEKMERMIDEFRRIYSQGFIGFKKRWNKKVKEYIDE